MNKSSRRYFLAVTGAGAAAAGAATLLPSSPASAQRVESMIDAEAGGVPLADAVLMACVTDAAAGEVTVIHGAEEITLTDPALAQRIALLSRKGA